jgi:hypothetical protein
MPFFVLLIAKLKYDREEDYLPPVHVYLVEEVVVRHSWIEKQR